MPGCIVEEEEEGEVLVLVDEVPRSLLQALLAKAESAGVSLNDYCCKLLLKPLKQRGDRS